MATDYFTLQLMFETVIPEQIILVESMVSQSSEPKHPRKPKKSKNVSQRTDSDEEEEQLIREAGEDGDGLQGEKQAGE